MEGTDVIMTVNGGVEVAEIIDAGPALLGFETARYRPPDDLTVDFCDWPFTADDASLEQHMEIVKREKPKYAVAPDVEGEYTLEDVIDIGDELLESAEHVIIIPKECPPGDIPECFRIGYPNQPNWGSNGNWWKSSYPTDRPVHVLGGSPESQFEVADYLTVGSVDGANVAAYAQYGRIWTPGKQLERPDLSYYERIAESLANIQAAWNMKTGTVAQEQAETDTPDKTAEDAPDADQ